MAALTFSSSSITHSSSSSSTSFRLFSPKTTPHLSFHSQFNRSSSFPNLSLQSKPTSNKSSPLRRSTVITGARKINEADLIGYKKYSETDLIVVPESTDELTSKLPAGTCLYAVHDKNSDIQFIGLSNRFATSIIEHRKRVPELCYAVKYIELKLAMEHLLQAWKLWMDEHVEATGKVPPGNADSKDETWWVEVEDEASIRASTAITVVKELSKTDLIAVPESSDEVTSKFPSDAGVYAVHDKTGDVQFIGISRNIAASIQTHLKSVPELCSSVKVGLVNEPDKASLTQAWKVWMEEYMEASGKIPIGNTPSNTTWYKKIQKKADIRLTPGRNTQLTVPLEELIDRLVKEHKVVTFIKGSRYAPQCGFSQKVVGILESAGVDFESVDVLDEEHNSGLREKLKSYSNWPTFPQIFVNGELVGGCDILTSMVEKGELESVFKK